METSKLINGDCLEELKKLDEDSVDLLCTDPPYGYGFMGKKWDKFQVKEPTKSQSVGWMSPGMKKEAWNNFAPEGNTAAYQSNGMRDFFLPIWKEALRVLKPGAFSFVMSAPRSDVQTVMVQTLQEAGFDVSFTPIYWTYATGFPKAMNIGKAVDRRLNKKRKVVGVKKRGDVEEAKKKGTTFTKAHANRGNKDIFGYGEEEITTGPASDEAKKLDGSYAGYQPKPAVEVVIVAMKPLEKKGYLDQALDNGKGVTWLDSCRIPFAGMSDMGAGWWGITKEEQSEALSKYHIDHKGYDDGSYSGNRSKDKEHYMKSKGDKENYTDERGWDQWGLSKDYEKYKKDNVGSQENFDTEPEGLSRGNQPSRKKGDTYERVSAFGDSNQSETKDGRNLWGKKATKKVKITKRQPRTDHNVFKQSGFKSEENDTAEASPLGRFVANLVVSDDVLKEDFSRYYSLDAWWRDRFKRLPEEIQRTFPFLVVPKASKSEKNMGLDKFEVKQKDERTDIGKGSFTEKGLQPGKNVHPTVKPMTLMSYLVTLGSRKNDVVLDPFMGSGTTPMACVTLSRNYIGIEREDEYFKIAEARVNKLENPIKQWEQWI